MTPLFALVAPFILWPIEQAFPYPYLFEELVKLLLVIAIVRSNRPAIHRESAVLCGVSFTLSETVLYFFNIFPAINLHELFLRLLLTGSLHIGTTVLLLLFLKAPKQPYTSAVGFAVVVVLHYLFNVIAGAL